ncbi:MAG: carbohydrate kinase [Bacilli bacterium]
MIVCIGEILVDLIGQKVNNTMSYQTFAGGAPFNVACGIAKYGGNVQFVGNVGVDLMGQFLIDFASKIPFSKTLITEDPFHNTTLAFVANDDDGERHFSFYHKNQADFHIPKTSLEAIKQADIVHLGSLLLSEPKGRELANHIIKLVKKSHKSLSFDVNYRDDLFVDAQTAINIYTYYAKKADYLKISQDELILFTGETDLEKGLMKLTTKNQIVFLTLGKDGSVFFHHGRLLKVPSIIVKPIDTTGAGDAFYAGVLVNLDKLDIDDLTDEQIVQILRFGNISGALVTTKKGAIDALPTLDEINNLM